MAIIYLVRHASYTEKYHLLPGRLPVELSEKGEDEAKKLKTFFQDKNIERIYSSAVLRCKQTSNIISNNNIPITYDKRLLEGLSAYQGFWEPDEWDQFWQHRDELGGESNRDYQKRVLDFIENTSFDNGKNYIICSHGDALYYIYHMSAELPPIERIDSNKAIKPNDYQQKGSVRVLKKKDDKWTAGKTITQDDL